MCQSGPGGIALVTGVAAPTPGRREAGGEASDGPEQDLDRARRRPGARPHRRRQRRTPRIRGAPTALNNACVIYEKLYQFGEATKCYERLYHDYPDSEWGKEALWNASRNHYRFFEFDQAVKGYLTVARTRSSRSSEHRKEALGLTASLLDNDQQYGRAADMYKKYSEASPTSRRTAPRPTSSPATPTRRPRTSAQVACLKDFIKKFDKQPAAGEYVVQAYMKLAVIADARARTRRRSWPPTSGYATSSSTASCRPRRRRPASRPRPTSSSWRSRNAARARRDRARRGSMPSSSIGIS